MRGGEKCLEPLCRRWPDARLFTLLHKRGSVSPVIEGVRVPRRRNPIAMRRLEIHQQAKWSFFRSILKKEKRLIAHDVVGVAAKLDLHAAADGHGWIEIGTAAAGKNDPLIEPGRVGTQMPFATSAVS